MKIVCLISDTFRFDHLGYAGLKDIRTPELDMLAGDAVFFEKDIISSFPTIPDREDMFTGRYSFPFHGWQPLEPDAVTLAEILEKEGYVTQLIADTPHLMKRGYNYDRGFIGYYWIRGQEGDIPFTRDNYPVSTVVPMGKTRVTPLFQDHPLVDKHKWVNYNWFYEEDRFVARTAQAAGRWLEDNYKADDFFLWVDTFDAHEPWDPPEYMVDYYDRGYKGIPMLHPNYGHASVYTPEELKNLQAHYAAEVTLVSKWLGYILRKLHDLEIYDETLVIFTTDHGMYLGEHDRTGKSNLSPEDKRGTWPLYEEITHIPLLIKLPGKSESRKIKDIVQPPDLAPTILDAAGIKSEASMHGYSLLPLIQGKPDKDRRDYAFSAYSIPVEGNEDRLCVTVTSAEWTLVLAGHKDNKPELFNIKNDSQQENNLYGRHREIEKELSGALIRFLETVSIEESRKRVVKKRLSLK